MCPGSCRSHGTARTSFAAEYAHGDCDCGLRLCLSANRSAGVTPAPMHGLIGNILKNAREHFPFFIETLIDSIRFIVRWVVASGWKRLLIVNSHFGNDKSETCQGSGRGSRFAPGKRLEPVVEVGASVEIGQKLLVLEAMKMEIPVNARAGLVLIDAAVVPA